MARSGHKTRAIFDRYNIVSETDLREADLKVAAYLAEPVSAANRQSPPCGGDRREAGGGNVLIHECRRSDLNRHEVAPTGF